MKAVLVRRLMQVNVLRVFLTCRFSCLRGVARMQRLCLLLPRLLIRQPGVEV